MGSRAGQGETRRWLDIAVRIQRDACILWPFATTSNGYGMVSIAPGRRVGAHVAALILSGQPQPEGQWALHKCPGGGNRRCVNVRHLAWGTHRENVDDMLRSGRHTPAPVKVTDDEVREIRRRVAAGEVQRVVAADYGITQSQVSVIARHLSRGDVA